MKLKSNFAILPFSLDPVVDHSLLNMIGKSITSWEYVVEGGSQYSSPLANCIIGYALAAVQVL